MTTSYNPLGSIYTLGPSYNPGKTGSSRSRGSEGYNNVLNLGPVVSNAATNAFRAANPIASTVIDTGIGLGATALFGETGLGPTFGSGRQDPNSAASLAGELGANPGFQRGTVRNNAARDLSRNTASGLETGLTALPGGTVFEAGQLLHGEDTTGRQATGWTIAGVVAGLFGLKKSGAGAADEISDVTNATNNVTIRNAHLAGDVHPVTKIPFNKQGFPDFSGVAAKTVKIQQAGNHTTDVVAANKAAGLAQTPKGYVWHHHQDGRTMQLVPENIHAKTGHTGGVAIKKAGGK